MELFKVFPLNQEAYIIASHLRKNIVPPEIDTPTLASAIKAEAKHFYTFNSDSKPLNNHHNKS